ncbi:MAG: tRNA lysidine(34) synthetase TilS [Rothia sp. (in: high G+C Gram-positive bacteria)]|nr:tRNA lysidine(34) synthetase TilS [Rothia sp. (in: high G+C Gram-positive bacteria)]
MQNARKGRLHPAVGLARNEVADSLNDLLGAGTVAASGRASGEHADVEKPLVLVACSGGPDSLALVAICAHFARRGSVRVGAVVVDHQLQEGSGQVAQQAAQQCTDLGVHPVLVKSVRVDNSNEGPEMAARLARYGAFEEAVAETGAVAILLAHTLDDQAETVLLGLARGSGTRSLAGMPKVRGENGVTYLRPLLQVRRTDIEKICAAENLTPWNDPTNTDQTLMRAKVRHSVLPYLEENLGGDVAISLARTASIAGPDADFLHQQALQAFESVTVSLEDVGGLDRLNLPGSPDSAPSLLLLNRQILAELHPALMHRVLALAVKKVGGESPGFERLSALTAFAREHSQAGPLQLAGHVSAYRRRPTTKLFRQDREYNFKQTGVIAFIGNQ